MNGVHGVALESRREKRSRRRVNWPVCWISNGNHRSPDLHVRDVHRGTAAGSCSTWQSHPKTQREHTEGKVAKSIEAQTAKLPSDTFLWAAVAAMGASATLQMMGNRGASVFVGQWAPTLLILGLYNKLVKQHGSDFTDKGSAAAY